MPHQVTLLPSARTLTVERDESVLAAAQRAGVFLPYGCRDGRCGECEGKLVSGEVAYPEGRPAALNEQEEAVGQALLCRARPAADLEVEVREAATAADIPPRRLAARVAAVEDLGHDVRGLWLTLPGGERLPYLPGQHLDVLLKGERRRAFWLANPPHDDARLELHVGHVPGGEFSGYAFGGLREGSALQVEGPFGRGHWRGSGERPLLLVAAGTGFAPVKAMVEHALHVGDPRPIHVYRGARAARDLYLDTLARHWSEAHPQLRYVPALSAPEPADAWRGRTGLVHEVACHDHPELAGFETHLFGPPDLVEAARATFLAHGIEPDHLHCEACGTAAD